MNYEQTRNITVENITYQANPAYFDPEFDEPHAIMFTGGFNSNVLLKQGNEVITSQTEILVDDWDVSIEDAGNTTDAHNAAFTFRIMDKGSGKWSEVEGTVEVSIRQFNNQPPFADAGDNKTVFIPTSGGFSTPAMLDGSGSHDDTGEIVSYVWEILSKPLVSAATITNPNNEVSALSIPNEPASLGNYEIQLTVTDEFGLSDTDTVTITAAQGDIEPE